LLILSHRLPSISLHAHTPFRLLSVGGEAYKNNEPSVSLASHIGCALADILVTFTFTVFAVFFFNVSNIFFIEL
jgi:hypothetical protein